MVVKWTAFKVSGTDKTVIFSELQFLHAQMNPFECFLSNKNLEESAGVMESSGVKDFSLLIM